VGTVPGGRRGDGAAVADARGGRGGGGSANSGGAVGSGGGGGGGGSGGGGAGEGADRVAAAAGELYGADPREFTERRKALAAAARDAGDADAARQIAGLRKPTRAAWVVNRLARADPGAAGRLASLAAGLRAAERASDGRRLRELSAERGSVIDALTGQALTAAGTADAPAGLREEVAATLTAALTDPEVAAALAAGTLTRAAQWAGFGFGLPLPESADGTAVGEDDADAGAEADDAAEDAKATAGAASAAAETAAVAADAAEAASAARTPVRDEPAAAEITHLDEARRRKGRRDGEERKAPHRDGEERKAQRRAGEDGKQRRHAEEERRDAEEERRDAEERRQAEEAAEAAAHRRRVFEEAERGVASAATVAMDAVAAEDRLEREVRDLEERLTRTRADLADARLRARRAEAAERKARQALARLHQRDE
jgi:hypothetical protein